MTPKVRTSVGREVLSRYESIRHLYPKFFVDDINEILAIRYESARCREDFQQILASKGDKRTRIEKIPVRWTDEAPDGCHAYEMHFINGSMMNIFVWD